MSLLQEVLKSEAINGGREPAERSNGLEVFLVRARKKVEMMWESRGCERVEVCGFVEFAMCEEERKRKKTRPGLLKELFTNHFSVVARAMRLGAWGVRYEGALEPIGASADGAAFGPTVKK